jgi:glycerol uptake facilitator-like aquaporin
VLVDRRHVAAEFIGTALLVMSVVGSGIMAESLSKDVGVQLLANAIATGGALLGLITIFGPLSGASFNPVVTVVGAILDGGARIATVIADIVAQVAGAVTGSLIANAMFSHTTFETSQKIRTGGPIWFSEVVATVGLLLIIWGGKKASANVAALVAAWITGAYWFTSSTSIANPAVGFGRMFSNSFAGIAPESWPMFAVMEVIGGVVGLLLIRLLFVESTNKA